MSSDRRQAAEPTGRAVEGPAEGVDRTLLQWMLSLSPTERLEVLQRQVAALVELQRAARSR